MTPAQARLLVVRIENPHVFGELELMRQLHKWTPEPHQWLTLASQVQSGEAIVYGASTRPDKVEGMFIIQLPTGDLSDMPYVVHFRCEGGVKLERKMVSTLVDAIRDAGYSSFGMVHKGPGHAKPFAPLGKPTKIATIHEYKLEVEDELFAEIVWGKQADPNINPGGHNAGRAKGHPNPVRKRPKRRVAARGNTRVARPVRSRDHGRRNAGARAGKQRRK